MKKEKGLPASATLKALQAGISTLLMILIIVGLIVVVGVGLFIYQYLAMQQTGPTACTEEAKVCPDGSTVSRTGPNCEFTSCPTGISVDSLNNATLSYPNPYDVSKTDTFALVNGKTDVIYDTGNMKPRVYTATTTAIGDLDGDGIEDGAIGIYQGYGANIIVPIVFVFSSKNGVLTQIDSVLPDTSDWNYETQIKSLSIDNGVLSVNLLVLAEKDQSLPHYQQQASVEKTVQYKLVNGKLVVQSDQTAGWKTYTNTQYGYQIKYPTDWSIENLSGAIHIGCDWRKTNPCTGLKASGIQVGAGTGRGLSIGIKQISFEDFKKDYVIKSQENYSLDGVNGWKFLGGAIIGIGLDYNTIFVIKNNNSYIITYPPNSLPIEEQILSTFKFTK